MTTRSGNPKCRAMGIVFVGGIVSNDPRAGRNSHHGHYNLSCDQRFVPQLSSNMSTCKWTRVTTIVFRRCCCTFAKTGTEVQLFNAY